jgi:hypothetical protein
MKHGQQVPPAFPSYCRVLHRMAYGEPWTRALAQPPTKFASLVAVLGGWTWTSGMPWCVFTPNDRRETLVAGPLDLIERIVGIGELEAHTYVPDGRWADGSRTVWIEPDFAATGLWERVAGESVTTDPEHFPLSRKTRDRLTRWVVRFESTYNPDTCTFGSDDAKASFEREQWEIWRLVRDELPLVRRGDGVPLQQSVLRRPRCHAVRVGDERAATPPRRVSAEGSTILSP